MKHKQIIAAVLCLCISAGTMGNLPQTLSVCAEQNVQRMDAVHDIYLYQNAGDHIVLTACSTMAEGAVEVPETIEGLPVTEIGEHCFAGTKVTEIKLPESVQTIGKQAFCECANLTEVNIPEGVTELGDEVFLNCTSLDTKVTTSLPESLTTIGVRAFRGCTSLTEIRLPDHVTEIGMMAFGACSSLTDIRIPESVTVLPINALYFCENLKKLTLPDSVIKIDNAALPTGLEQLTVGNKDCVIDGSNAFFAAQKTCTIFAPAGGKVQKFAEQYGYVFAAMDVQPIRGDVNNNGALDVLDIVMMQKWLLGAGELVAAQAADYNDDGAADIFDLALMKRELLELTPPFVFTAKNLMQSVSAASVDGAHMDEAFVLGQMRFALSLLKNTASEDTNTFVSPYSVVQALGMTANGAVGDTKAEMEQTIGGMEIEQLNPCLYTQRTTLPNDERSKLTTANSIWFRDETDRILVNPDFLQTNADYYGADAYAAPFDQTTVDDINAWVDDKTDHMIPSILDELTEDNVMCLINAVTFDAKWETPFYEECVSERPFTAYDGTVQQASMMHDEVGRYLHDAHAEGFYKYYSGRKYAFAALLPEEGMTVTEYLDTLTPESLYETLSGAEYASVDIGIPKFSYDFELSLKDPLCAMGMPTAFDSRVLGKFSAMAWTPDDNLYISDVLHKTHIDVFEEGTKAAAVSGVIMDAPTCEPVEPNRVILDRPFVYCIVDTQTYLPIFMGTLMELPE